MKLYILKDKDQIITKIINENGESEEFSNLKMIDYLYENKGVKIELKFDDSVSIEEQDKINSLFEEIYEIIDNEMEKVSL